MQKSNSVGEACLNLKGQNQTYNSSSKTWFHDDQINQTCYFWSIVKVTNAEKKKKKKELSVRMTECNWSFVELLHKAPREAWGAFMLHIPLAHSPSFEPPQNGINPVDMRQALKEASGKIDQEHWEENPNIVAWF